MKAIECNFAHRGVYFLEDGELRERNPDFESDGAFVEERSYEFEVDPGEADSRTQLMLVGDKEAICRYDRVPESTTLRWGFWGNISDSNMSSFVEGLYVEQWRQNLPKQLDSEYTRSVYSENGVLHIFDQNLGVIKVDQYGNVM
jgi:hypothetical protein